MGIRKKISADFKLKVVLEALKEKQTLSELSQKYEVAGSQISTWKAEFLARAGGVFGVSKAKEKTDDREKEQLFATIGRLQHENDFLKKKLS